MCGIAGYFGQRADVAGRIAATLSTMERRGPDAQAARSFSTPAGEQVWLLHARLKIIDLESRADQPFHFNGKTIVFNGEIYNYVELRHRLEALGHRFTTSSDTEVLIHHLDAFGIQGIADLEGMWAFALFDHASGELVLSRDRFGEKPLYLCHDQSGLYFASEPKTIFALLGRTLAVDTDHIARFIVNGYKSLYKSAANQFFRGLEVVAPGTVLRLFPGGGRTHWRYWRPTFEQNNDMSFTEAVAGVRDRLIRSLELRLRADVPLAFMLSGGVDSTSLISIAHRVFGYDVHGFTVIADDPRYDEREAVRTTVAELGIRHTELTAGKDGFIDRLRQLVRYHDAPVATTVDFAIWQLMGRMKDAGYKVTIAGNGSDELFTGYYDHHVMYLAGIRDDPGLHAHALAMWREKVQPIVRNPYLSDPDRFSRTPCERRHIYLGSEMFSELFRQPWEEPFSETVYSPDLLRNRMANEMFHESVPLVMHEEDLNAMYHSLENRAPFLDRDLFEFANSIPTRHLVKDGTAKAILREAVRGIAPDHIVDDTRKVGFNVPTEEYLDLDWPPLMAWLMADGPLYDQVDRARLRDFLTDRRTLNSRSKTLFNIVSCKLFLEEFA